MQPGGFAGAVRQSYLRLARLIHGYSSRRHQENPVQRPCWFLARTSRYSEIIGSSYRGIQGGCESTVKRPSVLLKLHNISFASFNCDEHDRRKNNALNHCDTRIKTHAIAGESSLTNLVAQIVAEHSRRTAHRKAQCQIANKRSAMTQLTTSSMRELIIAMNSLSLVWSSHLPLKVRRARPCSINPPAQSHDLTRCCG